MIYEHNSNKNIGHIIRVYINVLIPHQITSFLTLNPELETITKLNTSKFLVKLICFIY